MQVRCLVLLTPLSVFFVKIVGFFVRFHFKISFSNYVAALLSSCMEFGVCVFSSWKIWCKLHVLFY